MIGRVDWTLHWRCQGCLCRYETKISSDDANATPLGVRCRTCESATAVLVGLASKRDQ